MISPRFSYFVVSSILLVISSEEIIRWCDPFKPYCLFTFGSQLTVSNPDDAQKICSEAKAESHLLEINNTEEFDIAKEFWKNVPTGSDLRIILGNASTEKKLLNFSGFPILSIDEKEYSSIETKFGVICQIDCHADLILRNQSKMPSPVKLPRCRTFSDCLQACETEKSLNCYAFEWETMYGHACWIFPLSSSHKITFITGGKLFIVNRTSKTPERCIGDVTMPFIPSIEIQTSGSTVRITPSIEIQTPSRTVRITPSTEIQTSTSTVRITPSTEIQTSTSTVRITPSTEIQTSTSTDSFTQSVPIEELTKSDPITLSVQTQELTRSESHTPFIQIQSSTSPVVIGTAAALASGIILFSAGLLIGYFTRKHNRNQQCYFRGLTETSMDSDNFSERYAGTSNGSYHELLIKAPNTNNWEHSSEAMKY